jgi:hypothetical protein
MAYSQDRPTATATATRARQGRTRTGLIWVLVLGVALTILGFAATWAWKAGDFGRASNPNDQAAQAGASNFSAPRPDAASRQNYQTGGPVAPKNGGNPQ